MSYPHLEYQGCPLIPLYYLLICSSSESCYSFCLVFFPACWHILLTFFQKLLQYFSLRDRLFLYGSCLAVRRRQLVGGMCSMLPYDTFFKSGNDKSTEWSTIPACPSLMCFFNRGDTEGTNSLKILCPMFVCFM